MQCRGSAPVVLAVPVREASAFSRGRQCAREWVGLGVVACVPCQDRGHGTEGVHAPSLPPSLPLPSAPSVISRIGGETLTLTSHLIRDLWFQENVC